MRRPPKLLLWLLPPALVACAVALESRTGGGEDTEKAAEAPPPPTMNHAAHLAADLLCIDCHDPDETGDPKLPTVEICQDCHDPIEEEPDRVQAYFDAVRQPDGTYAFPRLSYSDDLVMNHPKHAEYEVGCAECHGEPSTEGFRRPAPLALKKTCMGCHEERGASNDCAVCHAETRRDRKPASHDAAFRANHGAQAPEGWREGEGASCALCHEVPDSCTTCHSESKPRSHAEAGFRLHHGRDWDGLEAPWGETSCALCHEEQSCVRCHQVTKPRSHTVPFERRLHGIAAAVERQSCMVCHQQDTCIRCHQTTQPLSHRGSFARGRQTHCIACHEPLQSSGCFACHKHTLGHRGQTPTPGDAVHIGASDPVDCEECHVVLPHLNDGGSCRRCHR